MVYHNRVRDAFDESIDTYQSNVKAFVAEAASFNFVKKVETHMKELLNGPERYGAEENISAIEKTIRQNIADTEEDIIQEQKRARNLNDKLDELERDFRKHSQK